MTEPNLYQLGFENQTEELENVDLKIEGKIPQWLKGSYIVNGSVQAKFKTAKYNHWFDGLAMLKKFEIRDGEISYSNKFLKTKDYLNNNVQDKINYTTFGTNSSDTPFYIWEKFLALTGNILSDNTSVSTSHFLQQ